MQSCAVCGRAGIVTTAEYRVVWAVEPAKHAVYGTGPVVEVGESEYLCGQCVAAGGEDAFTSVEPIAR